MILAIDTSTPICSVALTHAGEVLYHQSLEDGHVHVAALAPFMSEALTHTGPDRPLDGLALATGPGSFNGLRIGVATIKAFAWVKELPVVAIPSLDALAYQLRDKVQGSLRALLFSHRDFLHYADFHLGEQGAFTSPVLQYGTVDEALSTIVVPCCGDSRGALGTWFEEHPEMPFMKISADARAVGLLAEARWDSRITELQDIEPVYNATYQARKWVPPTH